MTTKRRGKTKAAGGTIVNVRVWVPDHLATAEIYQVIAVDTAHYQHRLRIISANVEPS